MKVMPDKSTPFIISQISYCQKKIKELKSKNVPIVYADESCLTTKLLLTHQWMVKGKNVEVDEKKLNAKTCAFVVALSEDKGLVAVKTFHRSLDQLKFIEFLKVLRRSYGTTPFGLYIDNASFHKANSVKEYASKHDIELIYTPPYRPEFQPSEPLIGFLK